MNWDTIRTILTIAISSAAILSGLGYAVSAYFKGKLIGKRDELDTENSLTTYLKNQIETYKGIIKDFETKAEARNKEYDIKMSEINREMSTLKAVIDEKDKTIAKYLDILQNRSPELDSFMKESREKWMSQIEVIGQILTFMQNINAHLDTQNKSVKIDATIKNQ